MAGKKILVADDSLTIQKVIRLALSGDGYDIQTVSTGKEALEQASLFRPDICIIDVSLPQYDAYQIKEQFNAKPDLNKIPVILLSSAFEKVDEERMRGLGFSGHLIKPFDPSHLRSTLLSASEQNSSFTSTTLETILQQPIQHQPETVISESIHLNTPTKIFTPSAIDDVRKLTQDTFSFKTTEAENEWGILEPEVQPMDLSSSQDLNAPMIPQTPGNTGTPAQLVSVSQKDLEELIKKEVNHYLNQISDQLQSRFDQELRQYSADVLPNLAEKIIKEEIHKLLRDPPI